ncbi:hypothetical protein ACQKJZ_13470 [Sphingomonas sp. NPDC019816]|jgi:hypothetical protein|uniref:Stability/partitioning determinant n=1 Tax=Paracoccus denitrificans TaxID=266 RepID=A0A533HWA9_PARDE|nr:MULTISPECIES: hypothetical protein [Alphaproteobacteria]TAJ29118.1 MAG: hypothetical protein EPO59_15855 [Bosea sp. (in: a-proteobacteria)]TKW63819.1 MAG: hypothetical protein DI616_19095 [Paracoccus denitrificans]
MSERAKLSFDDIAKPKKREKPDLALLRQLSEDHGFPSRDPASVRDDGEGEGASVQADVPPPASDTTVTPPAPATPVAVVAVDPAGFRRRGRPPSDRLYPMNIKVSQDVANKLYELRDARPRQTFADVLEMLLDVYEQHGGDQGQ